MKKSMLLLIALLSPLSTARADEVIHWNQVAAEASEAAKTDPISESRNFAILHVAIHDAVNAAEPRYTTHLRPHEGGKGASATAAAAEAAHDVLVALYPASKARFDEELAKSLSTLPKDRATDGGVALGRSTASSVLMARKADGSERSVKPAPGAKPGEYRPTPPDLTPAFMAQWGGVKPFALSAASQFRPGPPPAIGSGTARADIETVRSVGGEKGGARDEDESEIARFWYENSAQGWNRITRTVAEAHALDLHENARLFALVNMAMADGFIAGIEAKYHYNYWRPVTAIREAGDGEWLSYLMTPPVPDYPSAHSILGAAAAAVLARYFGTDYVAFRVTSGDPYPGVTRSFWSFSEAARENGASRVFAGIHFPTAVAEGYRQGDAVGAWVFEHALRPAQETVAMKTK